jgi:outer membrane protein
MAGKGQSKKMRTVLIGVMLTIAIVFAGTVRCAPEKSVPEKRFSLLECISIALERNPQILSSAQGIVSARAGLTKARSSYYPQLTLSATEGLARAASTSGGSETQAEMDLTSRLTLWRRGQGESVAEGRASLQASEQSHVSTIQSLVSQVAQDYYGVLAARQLIGVAEGGVESAQAHLDQAKARIALGATAEVDALTAESDLAQAQLDLIDTRSTLRSAFAQLKNDMGLAPKNVFEISEEPLPEAEPVPSLEDAVRVALEQRPDVQSARASASASRYALAQAKIRRGPIPEVAAEYAQGYTDWESRDPSWNVLLSLSWPLFDGYATKADVMAAQASVKRSDANLQQSINQVGLEVENALVEAQRTRERLEGTAKSLAAAEARLAAAEGKYRQGVGILLEVIDARVAVTNARASQVRARYDYQTALVSLQRAMGTLTAPERGEQ